LAFLVLLHFKGAFMTKKNTPAKIGTLGAFLKELREQNGYSLRDVEQATEISNAYLSMLENDKIKKPAANNLHKLAAFFKVDLRELLSLAGILEVGAAPSRPPTEYVFSKENLTPAEEEELIKYLKFMRLKNDNKL
jgi:transcriptional regulator with XRE-family HTH domain